MADVNIADEKALPDEHPVSTPTKPTKRGIFFRISNVIDNAMRGIFFRLGLFVASNPIKVIILTLVFVLITLAGMIRFQSETRPEKLWVPTGTVALKNQAYVNSKYGRFFRFTGIAFTANVGSKGLATRDAFIEMLDVAEKGFNITAGPINPGGDEFNTTITFPERCVKTNDVNGRIMCYSTSAFNLFYPNDTEKIVFYPDGTVNFFASVRNEIKDLTDAEIKAKMDSRPKTSYDGSAFLSSELYANNSKGVYEAMIFTQFFENRAVDEGGNSIDKEADEIEEKWTKFLLEDVAKPGKHVDWALNSAFGQEESLAEALSGDLPLLSIGFVLLGIYLIFWLGDFHSIRSHKLLGCAALATTGIALGTCFGLSSAIGMFFGPVHQILPLLIIGIGADDCFHITRAADDIFLREDLKHKSVQTRVALALSQSGASITVTSFTNVAVFLLSGISKLPALRFFAFWAAIGVFFAWVYAITFYAAFVTLDFRRIEAKRLDCVPCLKPRDEVKELNWFKRKPGGFSRFFGQQFGPLIMRGPVRIVLLVLFVAGLGASIYGCTQLYLKFRFAFFYPSGTSQRDYQDVEDDYFEIGDGTDIYIRNRDLSSIENQERLLKLCDPLNGVIVKNEWIQSGSVTCWYKNMLSSKPPADGSTYYAPSEFYNTVTDFIKVNSPGSQFENDLDINTTSSKVMGCRFRAKYVYRGTNVEEVDALDSVRKSADSVGFGDASDGTPAAFPYTFQDTFSEQYGALPGEIGLSLGFASIAVAVVCLILVGHPVVAIVSVLVVGIIIIGVLGLTYYTGINLNSVSVITLVLCTGISVDFVVHIARAFLEHVGTRKERAIKALEQMGPPVFYAGFSTFLAIVVLSGARSYIFRVIFFGFFFLIILAFLHGLILGPIILSLVGPPSFYESEEEKEEAERQLEERFAKEKPVIQSSVIDDEILNEKQGAAAV